MKIRFPRTALMIAASANLCGIHEAQALSLEFQPVAAGLVDLFFGPFETLRVLVLAAWGFVLGCAAIGSAVSVALLRTALRPARGGRTPGAFNGRRAPIGRLVGGLRARSFPRLRPLLRASLVGFAISVAALGCASLTQSSPPPATSGEPSDEASCHARGGDWARRGLGGFWSCDLPTTDAGRACTGSDECESVCVAPGRCFGRTRTIGSCLEYWEDGASAGTICAD